MDFIKKNISLAFGIAIPILMILFVAASIYLPRLFIRPQFNFLYVGGDEYHSARQQYSLHNGKLVKNGIEYQGNPKYRPPRSEPRLFIYDVVKDESKEVSFAAAQNFDLDSNVTSPDGFEIVAGSRGGPFPFFFWSERDYNVRYLKGHNVSKKLHLQLRGSSSYESFRFLGWIL